MPSVCNFLAKSLDLQVRNLTFTDAAQPLRDLFCAIAQLRLGERRAKRRGVKIPPVQRLNRDSVIPSYRQPSQIYSEIKKKPTIF